MPTFTTIALENLLEPRNSYKNSSTLKNPPSTNTKPRKPVENHEEEDDDDDDDDREKKPRPKKPLNHIYISPALYTTPRPTPVTDSSSPGSVSPSPYVFNRKGRGGKSVSCRIDGFEVQENGEESCGNGGDEGLQSGEEKVVDSGLFGEGEIENSLVGEAEVEDEFVDPRCDSFSVASSNEFNDLGRLGAENLSVVSNQFGEFYDAIEDFSSDGSCVRNLESELRSIRLSLLEEIEKRKTAEDALSTMYNQWQRFAKLLLSQTGLTFPVPSTDSVPVQLDISALEQFSQEVIVARFVAEAIGKGEARAEAELAAEVVIESKDQEISRLRDRLQYYEAMNHEMSQRNLEAMEVARRQRIRKRNQRRWLWGCVGISIAIGGAVIAYSYAPQASESQPSPSASGPQTDAS